MKNWFIIIAILITQQVQVIAQDNELEKPLVTGFGKEVGFKIERTISNDGGRIVSFDGKLELIVPAGALKKKTAISIQAVNNKLPLGMGVAYKLEPSGIEFKEPVQLIFHYNEDEADEDLQSLLGIAMQNEKGQWFELFNTQIDSKAKTISGNITHFSVWSKFMELILYPRYARLKVGNTLVLNVITLKYNRSEPAPENIETNPVKGKKGDVTLTLLGPIILQYADGTSSVNLEVTMGEIDMGTPVGELSEAMLTVWEPGWFVNGIKNGNSEFGKISGYSRIYAKYKAPAEVPDKNPVEVSIKLKGFNYKRGSKRINNPNLKSKILIFDNLYSLHVESVVKLPMPGSTVNSLTYQDMSEMTMEIKKDKVKINQIENYDEDWYYPGIKCQLTVLKRNNGLVHIGGIKSSKVTEVSGNNGTKKIVEIDFSLLSSALSNISVFCEGMKTPVLAGGYQAGMYAYPQYIKFEAKDGLQIVMEFGRPGSDYHVIITVGRLNENEAY